MQDDRRNGNGAGNGGDSIYADAGPDEPTVVIAPDEFLYGAIGRLSGGLRGAADRGDGFRAMVAEGRAELVLEELDADLSEIEMLAGGARRGVARLKAHLKMLAALAPLKP